MSWLPTAGNGRARVVEILYPGKEPVWCGTVFAPREAKELEVERLAMARISTFLPEGFAVVKLVPGSLVFLPEDPT